MIALTLGLYLVISSILMVPFLARYLIVSRRDRNLMSHRPGEILSGLTSVPASGPSDSYYSRRFLDHS